MLFDIILILLWQRYVKKGKVPNVLAEIVLPLTFFQEISLVNIL